MRYSCRWREHANVHMTITYTAHCYFTIAAASFSTLAWRCSCLFTILVKNLTRTFCWFTAARKAFSDAYCLCTNEILSPITPKAAVVREILFQNVECCTAVLYCVSERNLFRINKGFNFFQVVGDPLSVVQASPPYAEVLWSYSESSYPAQVSHDQDCVASVRSISDIPAS